MSLPGAFKPHFILPGWLWTKSDAVGLRTSPPIFPFPLMLWGPTSYTSTALYIRGPGKCDDVTASHETLNPLYISVLASVTATPIPSTLHTCRGWQVTQPHPDSKTCTHQCSGKCQSATQTLNPKPQILAAPDWLGVGEDAGIPDGAGQVRYGGLPGSGPLGRGGPTTSHVGRSGC